MKLYEVGGSVRDKVLGLPNKDRDFAVEAESFNAMVQEIVSNGWEVFLIKPEYFTVRALVATNDVRDFVLCRKDGTYSDGRRPDSVEPGTIYDDLARRDFTMNAIAMTEDGGILDPYNGVEDIKDRVIRAVGSAYEKMEQDPLRMLRAVRFSITKDMTICPEVFRTLFDKVLLSKLEKTVSRSRIREELHKMFLYDSYRSVMFLSTLPDLCKIVLSGNIWLLPTDKGK